MPTSGASARFRLSDYRLVAQHTSGLSVTSGVSRDLMLLGARHELVTPNRVVGNCEFLVVGLWLFLGKIDHNDLRVFT